MRNETRNNKLMLDIIQYLQKRDLFDMVHLYVNGHHYSSDPTTDAITLHTNLGPYYDLGECDVASILEYSNPDILSMTFDGPLHDEYNHYISDATAEEDICKLCEKYHCYPEQGYAWSLAVYEE